MYESLCRTPKHPVEGRSPSIRFCIVGVVLSRWNWSGPCADLLDSLALSKRPVLSHLSAWRATLVNGGYWLLAATTDYLLICFWLWLTWGGLCGPTCLYSGQTICSFTHTHTHTHTHTQSVKIIVRLNKLKVNTLWTQITKPTCWNTN